MSQLENGRVLVAAAMAAVIMASLAVTFHGGIAEAATYTLQWRENPNLSHVTGKTKHLRAGDIVVFNNTNTMKYNVISVDYDRYTKCNGVGPDVNHNASVSITLKMGWQYFLCGVIPHCTVNGMKVAIFAHNR